MFKIGDKVTLNGCPFDEQIADQMLMYTFLILNVQTVTDIKVVDEEGTSGQWVKTDMTPDWIDSAWFKKI